MLLPFVSWLILLPWLFPEMLPVTGPSLRVVVSEGARLGIVSCIVATLLIALPSLYFLAIKNKTAPKDYMVIVSLWTFLWTFLIIAWEAFNAGSLIIIPLGLLFLFSIFVIPANLAGLVYRNFVISERISLKEVFSLLFLFIIWNISCLNYAAATISVD